MEQKKAFTIWVHDGAFESEAILNSVYIDGIASDGYHVELVHPIFGHYTFRLVKHYCDNGCHWKLSKPGEEIPNKILEGLNAALRKKSKEPFTAFLGFQNPN